MKGKPFINKPNCHFQNNGAIYLRSEILKLFHKTIRKCKITTCFAISEYKHAFRNKMITLMTCCRKKKNEMYESPNRKTKHATKRTP